MKTHVLRPLRLRLLAVQPVYTSHTDILVLRLYASQYLQDTQLRLFPQSDTPSCPRHECDRNQEAHHVAKLTESGSGSLGAVYEAGGIDYESYRSEVRSAVNFWGRSGSPSVIGPM